MNWQDRLRHAHVRRAKQRTHRKCTTCKQPRTICGSCAKVMCEFCKDHACALPTLPHSRKRTPAPTNIPAALQGFVTSARLNVLEVSQDDEGITFVCERPSSNPVAELITPIKAHIPAGYKLWGSGANKVGTFYITISH